MAISRPRVRSIGAEVKTHHWLVTGILRRFDKSLFIAPENIGAVSLKQGRLPSRCCILSHPAPPLMSVPFAPIALVLLAII
ncbi:hypothetical protein MSAN_00135200 [Mycena sanguinolenta]|uniref:Uncharacterized protein n=1 Tax=Mycena sanguinolenta TaxID=230812 RepID=A0A8H6ZDR1_9AGAR|nr:hypothetical protein MSAN_00135200 [Mycena sanguinolenta]